VPRRINPPAIVQLLEELKPLMASRGFRPVSEVSAWTGKFNVFSWVRQSWKEDLVRLGWRKPPVATYFLDAQWSVPRPGAGIFIAAGINAAYARRGSSDSSLPTELPVIGHSPRDGGVPRSSWTPSQRWRGVTAAPRGPEPLRSWHGQNEMVPASGRKPMRISNITSALTQCRERPPHPQRNLKKYVVAQGVPSGHSA
jgi:hypothetical protein